MDREANDTMRKHQVIVVLLFVPLMAHAAHLFEAGLRVGMADYRAQCTYVAPLPDVHAGFVLSYSYHSTHIVGLRLGATIDRHKAGFGKTDYTDSYTTIDVENELMQVDYSIGRLRELYTIWSVGFPLQLALSWHGLNAYVGPKVVFPLSCRWSETAENAALSVYYPDYDNRVYESYPLAASRAFSEAQSGTRDMPLLQWWLSAEICYDIPVYTGRRFKSYVSIGVYADYSLSDETDKASDRLSLLMLSDTRDGFPLHRMMTTVVTANRQGEQLVSYRKPFDVGIKLAYRFAPYNPLHRNKKTCRCYLY